MGRPVKGSRDSKDGFYNSGGTYKTRVNQKKTRECRLWENMRQRVTSKELQLRLPTYVGASICEEWLDFQNFANWYSLCDDLNKSNNLWELDKDLLSTTGGKIYSKDTCCFLPKELNNLHTLARLDNSSCGILGISKNGNGYDSAVGYKGGRYARKWFKDKEDAFYFYKKNKEAVVSLLIKEFKDSLSERAYLALLKWEVEDIYATN